MRKTFENVEIQEPPLQEMSKKRSCLRRSCVSGCGCIVLFLVSVMVLLKFATNPRPKELKNVPENFPESVTIYDATNIQKISIISGKKRGRSIEIAAYIPKIILSPLILALNLNVPSNQTTSVEEDFVKDQKTTRDNFYRFINTPVTDHRDTIKIEWSRLPAEPNFLQEFYEKELKKNGYTVESTTDTQTKKQSHFYSDTSPVDGVIYIEDNSETPGTDYLSLSVNTPPTN